MLLSISPGTYTIRDTDSGRVLDYYGGQTRIGTWEQNHGDNQKASAHTLEFHPQLLLNTIQWHVKCYPGNLGYAIQNVHTKKYIPMKTDGSYMHGADESDAAMFNLEHQFQNYYLIRSIETNAYLDHPYIELDGSYTPVGFTNKDTPQGCFWRLEKINDNTGSVLKPRRNKPISKPPESQPNTSFQGSSSVYTDDVYLYTDMLFNMPRMPFTRDQRVAALDWARKLGATNVPTIESFDECERRLEATMGNRNNPCRNE
ncbi:unnamed protein product [Rhizoctonia solani]|uniref:Uncharacterized protein n=1 Tax=Rhizoctonia solani TaxID=456999 RepID=A0A8H3BU91_9AGAM|nr:unnamed protein product [Rhizoctonia solani]